MKKYFITSTHDVYVDDFKEGETDHVNYYSSNGFVSADSWKDAAIKYLNDNLYYDINIKDVEISEDVNCLQTSVIVDEENVQASRHDIDQWKNGSKMLYCNRIDLFIEELAPVNLQAD